MHDILIIDDEPATRFTMIKLIESFKGPYRIVGEATNGRQGLLLLEEKRPDIVILDIMMPEVDGLSMLKRIREKHYRCQVIVLSAHHDFEYVRTSFQLSALDYLLKPIKREELQAMLDKAVEAHKREVSEREREQSVHRLLNKSLQAYREAVLSQLIEPGGYERVSGDLPGALGLEDGMREAAAVVFDLPENEERMDRLRKFKEFAMSGSADPSRTFVFSDKDHRVVMMEMTPEAAGAADADEAVVDRVRALQDAFCESGGVMISAGIGQPEPDLRLFHRSYSSACISLECRFATLGKTIFTTGDRRTREQEYVYPYDRESAYFRALAAGDEAATVEHLEAFFQQLAEQSLHPATLKQLCMQFGLSLLKRVKTLTFHPEPDMGDAMFYDMSRYEHIGDFTMQIKRISAHIINGANASHKSEQGRGSPLKRKVDQYLHAHYAGNIGLPDLAAELGLSVNYFCSLFKKEAGSNFVDYLTQYRLRIAKELLAGTTAPVTEIAERVGYSDFRYFLRVFKKLEGVTPSEFRQRI